MARGGKANRAGRPKRARGAKAPKASSADTTATEASAKRRGPRKKRAADDKAADDGASPVDIIIGMMRGDLPFDDARFKAAVAAAPYVHARRGTAEPPDETDVRHEDALKELE